MKLFHTSARDVQGLVMRTESGEGEVGRSRIVTSGLVGGKERECPCVGQVRLWVKLPETEWDVDLYSCPSAGGRSLLTKPLRYRVAVLGRRSFWQTALGVQPAEQVLTPL